MDLIAIGKGIYERGVIDSGANLVAERDGGLTMRGQAAACVSCHRPSGFGVAEASVVVPPVTGPALFANAKPASATPRRARGMRYVDRPSNRRPPYDDESLARAVRDGISPLGEKFHYLMPRYQLDARNMAALTAYLRQLSATASPGVEGRVIHIATVVAPGEAPARKAAMLDVLNACISERYPEDREGATAIRLHTWQLAGDPPTWERQLNDLQAKAPVFALLSGLGGGVWQPVHSFCEQNSIPCMFPNVDAPGSNEEQHHAFYFSQGVVLEAGIAARYISQPPLASRIKRVVQVFSADGAGAIAAEHFRQAVGTSVPVVDRVIATNSTALSAETLTALEPSDALLLWLDRAELARLGDLVPPEVALILGSGWLSATANGALPAAWMKSIRLIHPFDAPARLEARMAFNLRPWLKANGLGIVDERLQGSTFAACSLLTESVGRMRGSYVRERLIELVESYPSAMGNAPAALAYPRFTLGPGQRYSSKGGYIVRFDEAGDGRLVLDHDWIVP